jgi:phosphonatase-like hydrolase
VYTFFQFMNELKLAIFDVVGTVIEDHGELVSALGDTLAAHGIGVGNEELTEFKGAAKREVIRFFGWRKRNAALSEEAVEAVYADFSRLVNRRYEEQLAPDEGTEEVFESLRKRGMQLALTTGLGSSTLELVVRRLGWQEWFSATVSSDEVAAGRPAPYLIFRAMERCRCRAVQEVVNVGDTPLDLQSAANAGVALNIGVLSGQYRRERLVCEPQDALLASVADLPTLLAQRI